VGGRRLALLVDDAEKLPLEAALALRQLEREAAGNVCVVAACPSDQRDTPAITALGPAAREILLPAGDPASAAALVATALIPSQVAPARATAPRQTPAASPARPAARRPAPVLGTVAPALRPEPQSEPAVLQRAPRSEPQPEPAVQQRAPRFEPQPQPVVSQPAPRSEPQPAPAAPQPAAPPPRTSAPVWSTPHGAPRTIPLSVAIAMSVTSFLIPIAFIVGYFVGSRPNAAAERPQAEAAELPPVSTAPPTAPREASVAPAAQLPDSRRASQVASRSSPPREVEAWTQSSPRAAEAETPRVAPPPPSAAVEPPPAADGPDSDWGAAPTLLSVEPGSGGL
jgi:hypothetical protein